MQRFHASVLFEVCKVATWYAQNKGDHSEIGDESRLKQAATVGNYIDELHPLGLSASCASLKRMKQRFEESGCKRSDISGVSDEFLGRLIDETGDRVFFSLLPREIEYFNNPKRGWEAGIERFPSIQDDVEEANKCFALSRYPAAVFHSVQIVEAGLIELGKFLKVTDPHSGWTAVSQALKKVLDKKHQDRTGFEKSNFKFLEQVQGTVEGLKNAWRNKISHSEGRLILMTAEFSPEIAEEILFVTRAFMRRLADDLPKPKKAA